MTLQLSGGLCVSTAFDNNNTQIHKIGLGVKTIIIMIVISFFSISIQQMFNKGFIDLNLYEHLPNTGKRGR